MAKKRVNLYNQLLELMKSPDYYGHRLAPDNATTGSVSGRNTEDIGFEDLLEEGTLADSTGKRIPGKKGRGTEGRIDKIGRMLENGSLMYLYLPNENMPRVLYVDDDELKMSKHTINELSSDDILDIPESKRVSLNAARTRIEDPKRVNRRNRNDEKLSARASNNNAEEVFGSLVSQMRSTMRYGEEFNRDGVRNAMNTLLQSGLILDSNGNQIRPTQHGYRQELIDTLGKRLYDNQEPLYIFRPDEAYPREVYMDNTGTIRISDKPIDKMTDFVPKVRVGPFARSGWKNPKVFARDRYEIREKLKKKLEERAKKRHEGIEEKSIKAAKEKFDSKFDEIESMLKKASEAKEDEKSYNNGQYHSYGKGRSIGFDASSNTYIHFDNTNMSPFESFYARYIIDNGLIGKMDSEKREAFYKANYEKNDEQLKDEGRRMNAKAAAEYDNTFISHPENVQVVEKPQPEKKEEPAAKEASAPQNAPAVGTDDMKTMLNMMLQMMISNNMMMQSMLGKDVPKNVKNQLEAQQKLINEFNKKINPEPVENNQAQPENNAVEKQDVPEDQLISNGSEEHQAVQEAPRLNNDNEHPQVVQEQVQPVVEEKKDSVIADGHLSVPEGMELIVNENATGLNARRNVMRQANQSEPQQANPENAQPGGNDDNAIEDALRNLEHENDMEDEHFSLEVDNALINPSVGIEYNEATDQIVYFDREGMSAAEEFRTRYIISNNITESSSAYQDAIRELEAYINDLGHDGLDELKKRNEGRQNETRNYYNDLLSRNALPVLHLYTKPEWIQPLNVQIADIQPVADPVNPQAAVVQPVNEQDHVENNNEQSINNDSVIENAEHSVEQNNVVNHVAEANAQQPNVNPEYIPINNNSVIEDEEHAAAEEKEEPEIGNANRSPFRPRGERAVNRVDTQSIIKDEDIAFEFNTVTEEFVYFNKTGMSPVEENVTRYIISNNIAPNTPEYKQALESIALHKDDPDFSEFVKENDERQKNAMDYYAEQDDSFGNTKISEYKQPVIQNAAEPRRNGNGLSSEEYKQELNERIRAMRAKLDKKLERQNEPQEQEILVGGKKLDEFMDELDQLSKESDEQSLDKQQALKDKIMEISDEDLNKMLNEPGVMEKIDDINERLRKKHEEKVAADAEEKSTVERNSAKPGKLVEVELIIYRMEKVINKPLSENVKDNIYALYHDAKNARENLETRNEIAKAKPNDPKFSTYDASKDVHSIVRYECLKKVMNDPSKSMANHKKGLISMFTSRDHLTYIDQYFACYDLNYLCRGKRALSQLEDNILSQDKLDLLSKKCCDNAVKSVAKAETTFGKDSFAKLIHKADKQQYLKQHRQPVVNNDPQRQQQNAVNI